jgi:hypothetical protein
MREPGGEAAQEGKVLDLLRLAFELRLVLLETRLRLCAGRDVLHREEDQRDVIEAAGVQQDRARANVLKVMGHGIVIEDRILRQNLFQQDP